MMDEGYIKFNADWKETSPFPLESIAELNVHRDLMYQMGLMGAYPDGIGFGNISQRHVDNQFFISGSATGNFPQLDQRHYSLVTHFDVDQNKVSCRGPIVASSESMSHAVIYQTCPKVNVVIHVHHLEWWKQLLYKIPTTADTAPYGSPEMVREIIRLIEETDVMEKQVFAMAGHQEGLFGFGENFTDASHFFIKKYQTEKT